MTKFIGKNYNLIRSGLIERYNNTNNIDNWCYLTIEQIDGWLKWILELGCEWIDDIEQILDDELINGYGLNENGTPYTWLYENDLLNEKDEQHLKNIGVID